MDSKTLLASLAKSKSLTSDRGTDTIAKASLSSFAGHVPIYQYRGKKAIFKCAPTFDSFTLLCEQRWVRADLQHNWTFLLYINGNIGACNPGVGAEVP